MREPYPGRLDRAEPLARPTPRSARDAAMAINTTTLRSRRALLASSGGWNLILRP